MDNKCLTIETKDGEVILKKCIREAEGEIEIPSGITIIDFYAFRNCKGITSVKLPDSLKVINIGAFEGCQELSSVTIPDSVERISRRAFGDCLSLLSVELPNSYIHKLAFDGCIGLTSVKIPDEAKIENEAFSKCINIKEIILPNRIVALREYAFQRLNYIFEGVDLSQCVLIISKEIKEDLITHYFGDYNIKYE